MAAFAGGLLVTSGVVALTVTQAATAAPQKAAAAEFRQVELAKGVPDMGEPMSLAVLPDRSVLHTARDGTLRLTDANGDTSVAGKLPVYTNDEEGLQGVGVDPGFASNRFIYLYYAPPLDTPGGGAPETGTPADFAPFDGVNRLSRFVLNEDGTLDTGSEVTVLDVPASRGQCCHVGGDIDFDAEGNLYLSTGDDTNPFASDGYTPIDERADRNPAFDAQRSAGNTNDLRGKVLRIKVNADGSYDIPAGNLFAPGTEKTRPEIYAMGFRNPFRMSVDKATGTVYLGDYGPDAGTASDTRGPGGQVEFNRITEPGNFGWPYCTGDNDAYVDHDFATGSSGGAYDCGAPVNNSPHNTGLTELPPAQPAWIPYDGNSVPEFGNGSESPMGGPVYNYDPDLDSAVKFPEEFDGDYFAGEFGRRWIKNIKVDGSGGVESINDFPWSGTQVMDMAFGPDGALYVLDYGTGFGSGDDSSALYRIESVPAGQAGGTAAGEEPKVVRAGGDSGTAKAESAASVELKAPGDGQLFEFGDAVDFQIEVTDPDGGAVDCSKVTLDYLLGHDSHAHHLASASGCSGTLQTPSDGGHDVSANIFGVFTATYTAADGTTVTDQHLAQPRHRQAEHFSTTEGVEVESAETAEGGSRAGGLDDGDWIAFDRYLLEDGDFTARVAAEAAGGAIEVRADAPDGKLLGTVDVPATGGVDTYEDVTATLAGAPAGTTQLHLVFTGADDAPFSVDAFTIGSGGAK
ncbi:PQQ-dependent sugar dehydrogenase [Streptomyces sp. MAR4 CNX-425]|uniref:PQQ-dependent sugar dehydrogenase n=1 Tax=Streptomyces sp. MAR4 CNX-425 TaxID=3406343 RepID=UPI003B50C732